MADTFVANPGAGGETFASDDIGGVQYPRSKIIIGDDGVNDGDVSAANPLPVTGTITAVTDITNAVAVTNSALTELAAAINTSRVDVNIAASAATVAVSNSGLTELAGAINASAQMDVNIAASGATVAVSNAGLTELSAAIHVDDAAFTAATSSLVAAGGIVTADEVDSGDVGAFAMLANRQQKVTLYDSSGVELSVGGGTQYTEDGAAAANPVGNAIIVVRDDARGGSLTTTDGDNVALRGNNLGEAYVKDTDAAALLTTIDADTGGILTAVQIMDDWDESDRAKVNLIVGQAGVTAGAGNVAANTPRVTLAADDPAVALLGTIDADTGNLAGILTSVQLIDDAIFAEDVAAQAADKGIAILAVRRDADTTLVDTTNDYAPLQVDANGYLKVEIFDGGGTHTVDNNGTFVTQVDGSALTALQKIDDPVLVDDAAFTPTTSSVMMSGFQADEGSTDSVDEGDAGAARMTLDRKVIVQPQPHTAGGLSISRDIDLDNSTLTVVKNAPGQLYGWSILNTTTSTVYVKFYDATSGTLGTGTPVMTIGIPGNATDDTAHAQSLPFGILFATGICVGAGTGVADADNTDPGANGVVANIYYK